MVVSTASDLARWLREQLAKPTIDSVHLLWVITQETGRSITSNLDADGIRRVVSDPGSTGDACWDALLEGVVAYQLAGLGAAAPAWTGRTQLPEGWSPTGDLMTSNDWYLLDVVQTPAVLLDKGVVLARHNFRRL